MSRRIRAFTRWMKSQGIDCSDALVLVDSVDGGISVRALCGLREGDLVATIPKSACITAKTSGARDIIEGAGIVGHIALTVALLYERSLGPDSPWDGYLQILPQSECVPLIWSLEEVDSLLSGTELHKTVKEDESFLFDDWKEFIEPLILTGPSKLDPSGFGIEQYFSAKTLVASRSFQIDDYHGSGMVPLADLFNHKTGAEHVHFTTVSSPSSSDNEDDELSGVSGDNNSSVAYSSPSSSGENSTAMEMIIVREVEAGDEVFNTYGTMGNAALLHRYGFTELGNRFDTVNLDLRLVQEWCTASFSNRYYRGRLSLWRSLSYSGFTSHDSEYFEISFEGEPQLELVALLYIIALEEDAFQKLKHKADSFDGCDEAMKIAVLIGITGCKIHIASKNIKELMTGDVCCALKSLADMREGLYGSSSLKEDVSKLGRCCRSKEPKLYHSMVLRVSERRILLKLRDYASKSSKAKRRKV